MTVPIMAEPIGTTTALQEASIRARVRGFLKEIHFQEGGDVKAGQLLFVIDEEPFKAKLAEAQAALQQAEAALKKARDSKAREVAAAQAGRWPDDGGALGDRGAARAGALSGVTPPHRKKSSASRHCTSGTQRSLRPRRPASIRPRPTSRHRSSPPKRTLQGRRRGSPTPRLT